jgi:hypothetical protein
VKKGLRRRQGWGRGKEVVTNRGQKNEPVKKNPEGATDSKCVSLQREAYIRWFIVIAGLVCK